MLNTKQEWEKIHIQSNNIKGSTDKAVLINMPKTSKYKGYSFWHPKKLTRPEGKNSYLLSVSFTQEFVFKLKKFGKGQHNFNKVLDEKEISPKEFKESFGFTEEVLNDLVDG